MKNKIFFGTYYLYDWGGLRRSRAYSGKIVAKIRLYIKRSIKFPQ